MPRPASEVGSLGCADGFYPVVHRVREIWERTQAGELASPLARDIGLPRYLVSRVLQICRALGKTPSQRRLAVCCLMHPDMSDDDIASLFGRSLKWVEQVRLERNEIRAAEPFNEKWEYLDDGYQPNDPEPYDIAMGVAEIRRHWIGGIEGNYKDNRNPFGRRHNT